MISFFLGMFLLDHLCNIKHFNMMDGYTKFVAGYSSPLNPSTTMHDLLHDFKRIEYHKAYLAALLRAMR